MSEGFAGQSEGSSSNPSSCPASPSHPASLRAIELHGRIPSPGTKSKPCPLEAGCQSKKKKKKFILMLARGFVVRRAVPIQVAALHCSSHSRARGAEFANKTGVSRDKQQAAVAPPPPAVCRNTAADFSLHCCAERRESLPDEGFFYGLLLGLFFLPWPRLKNFLSNFFFSENRLRRLRNNMLSLLFIT